MFVMSRVIAVMACGFTLAACSGLTSLNVLRSAPPSEALRIESEPPGAEAKTSLGQGCRTPCELVVQSAGEFSVTLALAGYRPQTISVRPEAPAPADRDSETPAAMPHFAPNPVYVELEPAPAAPPAKPVAPKKKKAVATTPRPAPVTAAATPAPAAVPAPAAATGEPAASATNYPWPSR
jgi:hypothetical protein